MNEMVHGLLFLVLVTDGDYKQIKGIFQQEEIKMFDIEEMILERQESIADECHNCPYKGKCNNQCMEVEEHYNPNLRKMMYFKHI